MADEPQNASESSPAPDSQSEPGAPRDSKLSYVGVGCIGAVVGLVGGGMIAVMIAKIVGGLTSCKAAEESGAPCNWTDYWTWGARIGLFVVPAVSIYLLRRGRQRSQNSDRG